jgi:hypothetical protein
MPSTRWTARYKSCAPTEARSATFPLPPELGVAQCPGILSASRERDRGAGRHRQTFCGKKHGRSCLNRAGTRTKEGLEVPLPPPRQWFREPTLQRLQ